MRGLSAQIWLLSIGFSVLLASISASAGQPQFRRLSFIDQCVQAWTLLVQSGSGESVDIKKGEIDFLPMAQLVRGQDEISVDNVHAKYIKRLDRKDLVWNDSKKTWELGHHHGQSLVGKSDPIEVIKGPMGYVILDGHHDLFLSLWAGANSIAVEVKDDWSQMTPLQFWRKLQKEHLVYLGQTPEELAKDPPKMWQVKDNPNRYLATLVALKVKTGNGKENGTISETSGPDAPVWVKLNSSVPFVEFYIAKVLYDAGIEYDPDWGSEVPAPVMEKIRRALSEAVRSGKIPVLSDLKVFDFKAEALLARKNETALRQFLVAPLVGLCSDSLTK